MYSWYEQALVESVLGMRALRNSKEWSDRDIEKALQRSSDRRGHAALPYHRCDAGRPAAHAAGLGIGENTGTSRTFNRELGVANPTPLALALS